MVHLYLPPGTHNTPSAPIIHPHPSTHTPSDPPPPPRPPQTKEEEEEIDRTPWGELEPSDEESSEEEEEEESDEEKPDETGFITPADRWGGGPSSTRGPPLLLSPTHPEPQTLSVSLQWPHHAWGLLLGAGRDGDP